MARKVVKKKGNHQEAHLQSAAPQADGRMSARVDTTTRAANILQLKRARGQIDGVERMLLEDRYCADIIIQITAARASLQVVAKALLETHLKACHKAAMNNGGAAADIMYQELVDLVSKMAK